METIAVTKDQAAALLAAAKKRAQTKNAKGVVADYFKHVPGAVPSVTDNETSCAGHQLVRVVCGLRERANITHKSLGNVLFAPGTKLARDHPRGVACFMPLKRGRDFISNQHHDMARRTRPAPEGYDEGTIQSRRLGMEIGSIRQRLTTASDDAENQVSFLEESIDENVRDLRKALRRYERRRDKPNTQVFKTDIIPLCEALHTICSGYDDDSDALTRARANLATLRVVPLDQQLVLF
jgi:hypothetical protein